MEAQIDQNTEISKEFSLWAQSGSKYKRGDLFVIPIGTSLMYVEPVYLEASNQAIPEVKRVIVAYQDKIAYEPTLAEALVSLFGGDAGDKDNKVDGAGDDDAGNGDLQSLIQKAQNSYDKAIEAQKNGDWEAYGKYLKQLENYLAKMTSASGTDAPEAQLKEDTEANAAAPAENADAETAAEDAA